MKSVVSNGLRDIESQDAQRSRCTFGSRSEKYLQCFRNLFRHKALLRHGEIEMSVM
jgi:hypothetical protein